jgi:hypothetical protein
MSGRLTRWLQVWPRASLTTHTGCAARQNDQLDLIKDRARDQQKRARALNADLRDTWTPLLDTLQQRSDRTFGGSTQVTGDQKSTRTQLERARELIPTVLSKLATLQVPVRTVCGIQVGITGKRRSRRTNDERCRRQTRRFTA